MQRAFPGCIKLLHSAYANKVHAPPPPPLCLAGCHCNMAMTAVEAGMPCTPWRPVSGTAGDEGGTRGACTARAGQAHVRPARCPAPSQLLMPAPDGGLRP